MKAPENGNHSNGGHNGTGDGRGRWRLDVLTATMIAAALLPTACTSPGAPTTASNAGGSAVYQDALAFAQCMRSHGAPSWPDPNSQGNFMVTPATNADFRAPLSARQACRHLLPHGGRQPPETGQQLNSALKFAGCMRSHGVPGFPEPDSGGGFTLAGTNVDPNSPQVKRASQFCVKLVPAYGPA